MHFYAHRDVGVVYFMARKSVFYRRALSACCAIRLCSLFEGSLNPCDILANIKLALDAGDDREKTRSIFDEIRVCQAEANSLKFFSEQKPEIFIAQKNVSDN